MIFSFSIYNTALKCIDLLMITTRPDHILIAFTSHDPLSFRKRCLSFFVLLLHSLRMLLSSMYLLIVDVACCVRKYTSLQIMDKSTCNTFAISDWLSPLLSSSRTLALRHSTAFLCSFIAFLHACFSEYLHFARLAD